MHSLACRLWNDDTGAIISVEWLVVVTVLLFGLIPGLVAVRNGTDASLGTISNIILAILPNFTFSGFSIGKQEGTGGPNTGGAVARAGGYELGMRWDDADPFDTAFGGPPNPFIWALNDNALPGVNLPITIDSLVTVDPAP